MLSLFSTILIAAVCLPQTAPEAGSITREGEHFQLICHFENEAAADQAMEAVSAAWAPTVDLLGVRKSASAPLLKVHLYRNAQDYETAEQELTHGRFKRNLAFAHFDTMSAHVALQPPLSDQALAEMGLPSQTLRLLAHESVHLVRYQNLPNFRSHPDWLADGLASYVDEKVVRQLGMLGEAVADPDYSSSILRVQKLIKGSALPSVEQILKDQLTDLEFFERYDVRWLLFRFLMEGKQSKKMHEVLSRARSLGGGNSYTDDLFEEFTKIFGKAKFKSLNKGFAKYVNSFHPQWEQVYRALYFKEGQWFQSSFKSNAIAWRRSDGGKKYTISGELTIFPGRRQQLNIFLGRSDKGFFSVALSADKGVTLFEYLSATNDWQSRGYMECKAIELGKPFAFKIAVAGKEVNVHINGEPLIRGKAKTLKLSGPWALSAQSGSSGIWKLSTAPGL